MGHSNPPVPFHQAQQLKAMGMEQDNWPQYAYVDTTMPPRLRHVLDQGALLISRTFTTEGQQITRYVEHWAAPDTVSAILWVLGSEAGREHFGYSQGVLVYPNGECGIHNTTGPWGCWGDTPADLLAAMLEAVKENAS